MEARRFLYNMNDNPKSFSHEINQLVVAGFGMAFFLIFCACGLLLFLTEDDHSKFVFKLLIMLGIYLALYILYSIFIVNRIKKMFLPLDKIAYGIMKDQVFIDDGEKDLKAFADSLKEQAKQMSRLSQELKDTQENLDGAFQESKAGKESLKQMTLKVSAETEKLRTHGECMSVYGSDVTKAVANALDIEKELKDRRNDLYECSQLIGEQLKVNMRSQADTEAEFKELGGSYTLLDSVYKESEELIGSIYNEMTALQTLTSQINIYVMNTALDISRAGSITVSALGAMDEIKMMSADINDKTDNVLLLIIRARNALKLAMDQSGECRDKGSECSESFSKTKDYLEKLGNTVQELTRLSDELSDGAGKLTTGMNEVKTKEELRRKEEQFMKTNLETLGSYVKELRDAGKQGEE